MKSMLISNRDSLHVHAANLGRIVRVVALVTTTLALPAQPSQAAEQAAALPGESYVAIAPCRIVDTRVAHASTPAEEAVRRIDIATTRCGRFVPTVATGFAIRVSTPSRAANVMVPQAETVLRTAPSVPRDFPIPAESDLTVDLEGYYLPAGVITDPLPAASAPVSASSAGHGALVPHPEGLSGHDGTAGDLYLDGTRYPQTGIFGNSSAAYPWIMFMTADVSGAAGFGVHNGNFDELLRVTSSGPIRAIHQLAYFSGRTDYREWASIQGNVVHEVKIPNPRDTAGGATLPVALFDATTDDEVGSPQSTKFRAFTNGSTATPHINFDSQILNLTNPNHYHFRAFSPNESKETFWVKAAANPDATGRADMYLSGNLGVGTTSFGTNTNYKLHVAGGRSILESAANQYALGLRYSDANDDTQFWIGASNGAAPDLVFSNTNGTEVVRIGNDGNVTIAGNINAKFQDLAEWVPAAAPLLPGTVVVLNPDKSNEVMESSSPYDTAVAGVVSANPGLILGEASSSKAKIATTGRVKVHVDASAASIRIGDLLVTSNKAGTAMKSEPIEINGRKFHQPGTVIGKALEPLGSGEREILVLLSLQ